jgi:catechol 2,3-dioxygenase-like lactoylglutathione lyase family enzyme
MHVEQVDFVSVPTRDSERAVAWYRDVFGLPASEFSEGEVETTNVRPERERHRAPRRRR